MQYSNEQFLYMDFLFEFCFIDKYVWTLAKIFEMFTDKNVLDKSYNCKSRPCGFGQSLGRPIVWSSTKKNCSVSGNFFGQALIFWYTKKKFWYTKKKLGGPKKSETDQKFPETEQIFFWSTKKREK